MAGEHDVAVVWSSSSKGGEDKAAAAKQAQGRIENVCNRRCADLRGVVWLEDCGHWVMQEKGAEVNKHLVEFVDRVTTEFDAFARLRGDAYGAPSRL
jgi:pimeloyl-ACP methyl ester carboxylesterase